MPIRNPFARRLGPTAAPTDVIASPRTAESPHALGFERVNTVGSSKASSAVSIRSTRSIDTGDYKMSVVNDSGIYLPPSPPGANSGGLWPRKYPSAAGGRSSTDTPPTSSLGEIEPFGISRESFDSYRRSFDVSARIPVPQFDALPPRTSLDGRFARLPRSAMDSGRRVPQFVRDMLPPEEFEDVGLEDKAASQQPTQGRKRGFFAKFTTGAPESIGGGGAAATATAGPQEGLSRWIGGGRKRATSNTQGNELKAIESPKEGDEEQDAEEKEKREVGRSLEA